MYCAGLMLPQDDPGLQVPHHRTWTTSVATASSSSTPPRTTTRSPSSSATTNASPSSPSGSRTFDEPAAAISRPALAQHRRHLHRQGRPRSHCPQPGRLPRPRGNPLPPSARPTSSVATPAAPTLCPSCPWLSTPAVTGNLLPAPRILHGFLHRLRRPASLSPPSDMFDNVAWDSVRYRAQEKSRRDEVPRAGLAPPCSPTRSSNTSGFRTVVEDLVGRFAIQNGQKSAEEAAATMKSVG